VVVWSMVCMLFCILFGWWLFGPWFVCYFAFCLVNVIYFAFVWLVAWKLFCILFCQCNLFCILFGWWFVCKIFCT